MGARGRHHRRRQHAGGPLEQAWQTEQIGEFAARYEGRPQPLHFGNYGGMPLKILWALLDLLAILVLASGLYLWLERGNTDARVREIERMAEFGNADGAQA